MTMTDDINYQDAIKTLLEIQELEITLSEAQIMHQDSNEMLQEQLENLKNKIATLKSTVPEEVLRRYDQQRAHNHLGAANLVNGRCGSCRVSVPVGDINRMKVGKKAPVCHSCGIFLYVWED